MPLRPNAHMNQMIRAARSRSPKAREVEERLARMSSLTRQVQDTTADATIDAPAPAPVGPRDGGQGVRRGAFQRPRPDDYWGLTPSQKIAHAIKEHRETRLLDAMNDD